jgi:hypothetical protein
LSLDDEARLDGRGELTGEMAESDATIFKDLLVSTGVVDDLMGEIESREASWDENCSTVRDLRIGIGFGGTGGEEGPVDAAGCQRSKTDDFLGVERALSEGGLPPNSFALASS